MGFLLLSMAFPGNSFAQSSAGQTSGSVLRERMDQQKDKQMERGLMTEREPVIDEVQPSDEVVDQGPKIDIREIRVEGNTLLKDEELYEITLD